MANQLGYILGPSQILVVWGKEKEEKRIKEYNKEREREAFSTCRYDVISEARETHKLGYSCVFLPCFI